MIEELLQTVEANVALWEEGSSRQEVLKEQEMREGKRVRGDTLLYVLRPGELITRANK